MGWMKREVGEPVDWKKYKFLITFDGFKVFYERKGKNPTNITWLFWPCITSPFWQFLLFL